MKALGILAGPRKGGTSDRLIEAVLEGVRAGGGETEKLSLYDLEIKPCLGCLTCEKTGKCVINDDHRMLIDKMDSSDVVVFGSPAYWSNVTSEAKKFMDRSLGFFEFSATGPKRKKRPPGKVVLITSCGAPYPFSHLMGIIPGVTRSMKAFFSRMNAVIYPLYVTGMIDPEKSRCPERSLRKAFMLGKKL